MYCETFRDGKEVDADHLISTLDNGMPIVVNGHDKCVCLFIRSVGYWDSNETSFIKNFIKPGMKIVEVGANFGVHALRMAELVGSKGHIDTFEANPHVSKYLRMSIALNHLESLVTLHDAAAGNKAGEIHPTYGLSNIGAGHLVNDANKHTVTTKMVRLDDILANQKVDLLKMDAEGSEGKIIEGAKKLIEDNPNLIIMMEWAQSHLRWQGTSPTTLINYFKDSGFKVWKIATHNSSKGALHPLTYEALAALMEGDIVLAREDIK